jgi:hypothetical protein
MDTITLRIKRQRQTLFINVPPNVTTYKLKQQISKIVHKEVKSIRLLHQKTIMENNITLDQLGLIHDSVLFMVYAEGEGFEAVSVPEFEPL